MHTEDAGNVPSAIEQFERIESCARVLRERTDLKVRVDSSDIRGEPAHERSREERFQSIGQGSLSVAGLGPSRKTALENSGSVLIP